MFINHIPDMNQIRSIFLLFVLLVQVVQSQIQKKENISPKELGSKLVQFKSASNFFFETLSENFEGNRGESLSYLMKIITNEHNHPERLYKLQVNHKRFDSLNTSLEPVYDDFFPVHAYFYEQGSQNDFFNIKNKAIFNSLRDTIEVHIFLNGKYLGPENPIMEGNFKNSFQNLLLNDDNNSIVQEQMINFIQGTGLYSAFDLSYNILSKYTAQEINDICEIEYNRVLISLVFWEYLTHCANYDLNTRKFFYEKE